MSKSCSMRSADWRLLGWITLFSAIMFGAGAVFANFFVVRTYDWLYGFPYSYAYKALSGPLAILAVAFLFVSALFHHQAQEVKKPGKIGRFCPFCGIKLTIDVKYCPNCGKNLQ